MLHEILYKHLDGILVSRLYTEDQFIDLFARTIPESNAVIASQLYKSYEENDQRIIEKIDKLIDNKLSLIRVELEREQIEDSISLEEVNKLLHSIDDMLQQHLTQLNIELDKKNTNLLKYAMELSDVEAIDTSMYDNVAKLIRDMETNQPSS
ncbi:Nkp2 [Kluyveromyces lactis]|nr:Nkp2 [Kluyveromyces lactis]